MKPGTHLGSLAPVVRNFEELIDMINKDAEVIGKEIEECLKVCDLRIGYDREVLLLLIANLSAAAVSILEDYDSHYEQNWRDLFEIHLGEYRNLKNSNKKQ